MSVAEAKDYKIFDWIRPLLPESFLEEHEGGSCLEGFLTVSRSPPNHRQLPSLSPRFSP